MLKWIVDIDVKAIGSKIVGFIAPLLIPSLPIVGAYYFMKDFSRHVDKKLCTCSCWDTVFKGSYETGIAAYKHVYFNATFNSMKIWTLTVLGIILSYETVKYITWLVFQKRLRESMLILFLSSIFSHYYSWWMYFNYWNDDFYSQWYHQLFFCITEIISTVFVLYLADVRNLITHRPVFCISGIALIHIIAGGWDQFVTNVFLGKGTVYQIIRDLAFMIPDILHFIIPFWSLRRRSICTLPRAGEKKPSIKRDFLIMLGMVAVGLLICANL